MTSLLTAHRPPASRVPASPAPRLSPREDLLTVAFTGWLILGLFVDGWAHNNDQPETFFTPWHGLLYSGFLATAVWMGSRYLRHGRAPAGYGLGLVGVVGFALGGAFDMIWHVIFGVEVDLEALLSPSHLLLFSSALLILTSPLRAAWSDPAHRHLSLRTFFPPLLSATLVTAGVAFFVMPFSPFLSGAATKAPYEVISRSVAPGGIAEWFTEEVQLEGFAAILITTVVLMAPALLLLRRWELPFGSLTVLFGTVVTLVSATEGFEMGETALAGLIAGVGGDLLVRLLQRRATSPVATLRLVGGIVPAVLWLAYFGLLAPSTAWAGRSSCGAASPAWPPSPASGWPSS